MSFKDCLEKTNEYPNWMCWSGMHSQLGDMGVGRSNVTDQGLRCRGEKYQFQVWQQIKVWQHQLQFHLFSNMSIGPNAYIITISIKKCKNNGQNLFCLSIFVCPFFFLFFFDFLKFSYFFMTNESIKLLSLTLVQSGDFFFDGPRPTNQTISFRLHPTFFFQKKILIKGFFGGL